MNTYIVKGAYSVISRLCWSQSEDTGVLLSDYCLSKNKQNAVGRQHLATDSGTCWHCSRLPLKNLPVNRERGTWHWRGANTTSGDSDRYFAQFTLYTFTSSTPTSIVTWCIVPCNFYRALFQLPMLQWRPMYLLLANSQRPSQALGHLFFSPTPLFVQSCGCHFIGIDFISIFEIILILQQPFTRPQLVDLW